MTLYKEWESIDLTKIVADKAFITTIFDSVDQAIIITDMHGKITVWNKFAEQMYGWSADEVIGRGIEEVTVPQMSQEKSAAIMKNLLKGKKWEGNFVVQDRQGNQFDAFVLDAPVFDDDGNLSGIIGISRKTSDVLAVNREELAEQLQKTMVSNMNKMVREITHRFNNILMASIANFDLIRSNEDLLDEKERQKSMDIVANGLETMSAIISSFQILTGKKTVTSEILSLSEILQQEQSIINSMMNISLNVNSSEDSDADSPRIIIDKTNFNRVLTNILLLNDKYIPKSETYKVRIQTGEDFLTANEIGKNEYHYGMDPTEYAFIKLHLNQNLLIQLKNNFSQEFLGDDHEIQSLVRTIKSLIDAYQGGVALSEPLSTFTFYFPKVRDTAEQGERTDTRITIPRGSKFLIVDDNSAVLSSVGKMVAEMGFQPVEVDNGEKALEYIRTDSISFCILDLKMPGVDGFEIAKYLDKEKPDMPYLITSGFYENVDEIFDRFDKLPVFLAKPFTYTSLRENIDKIVDVE